MQRALQLALRGEGHVEPNPLVGCVIAAGERVLAEGWHRVYGKEHAEVNALRQLAGQNLAHASLYVTLEPCCHTGKTPPCTEAILKSGIRRVIVAVEDPFPKVSGRGITRLRQAGVEVLTGIGEQPGRQLLAPYLKLQQKCRPWVIAKWAMTLDGKLATSTGDSQWISNSSAREIVHQLRGRVDGILVGSQTAITDDPLLTARPAGPRTPIRIVLDSQARLADLLPDCQLARTASDVPVVVFASHQADPARIDQLTASAIEVVVLPGADHPSRVEQMLDDLGRRGLTNLLVEGGAELLGALLDAGQIDEVHAFVAPKLIGGRTAPSAIHGHGLTAMNDVLVIPSPAITILGDNVYIRGRLAQ